MLFTAIQRKGFKTATLLCLVFLLIVVPFPSSANDINSANMQFSKENYSEAISIYSNLVGKDKNKDAAILYRIGLCYLLIGKQPDAGTYFKQAKQLNPNIFDGLIFTMPSGGMEPTLLPGDYVIVDKEYYAYSAIKRNDVIVLKQPRKENNLLIKRIVGLPGEKLQIKDNWIYIGDKRLDDDRFGVSSELPSKGIKVIKDLGPIAIPEDKYFVLGDNRNMTFDSRHFGLVTKGAIVAKVLVLYGSVDSTQEPTKFMQDRIGLVIK
jgi:signal peptidase I